MRSHEERLDETTFEKTTRPSLDEFEALLQGRPGLMQTHDRPGPCRKTHRAGGRESANARTLFFSQTELLSAMLLKYTHAQVGCASLEPTETRHRTAAAVSSENTYITHDLGRRITELITGRSDVTAGEKKCIACKTSFFSLTRT